MNGVLLWLGAACFGVEVARTVAARPWLPRVQLVALGLLFWIIVIIRTTGHWIGD